MPINPSIPLQVQQYKPTDQMTTLGQLLGIKQAQSANALAEMQMARQQKEDARQDALRADLAGSVGADGTIDQTKVRGALARAGDINALGTYDANQATIAARQASAAKDKLALASSQLGYIGQVLGGVRDQASFDAAKAQVAQTLGPQALQGVPDVYDPQWVKSKLDSALGYKDRIDLQIKQQTLQETGRHNLASEGIQREANANKGPLALIQGADGSMTAVGGPNGVGPNAIDALGAARQTLKQREEFGKGLGKYQASQYTDILKAGDQTLFDDEKLNRLDQLLTNVETGKFKGTTTEIKKAAKSAGIDLESLGIKDDVAPVEAARALSNEMALQLRNPAGGAGMPGAMSDSDRTFLTSMVPGIETTPEGRKLMVQTQKQLNQRKREIAKMARDYKTKNSAIDEGFDQQMNDYAQKNPMFHAVTDDASFAQVPKGAYFLAPDGTVRQKQ